MKPDNHSGVQFAAWCVRYSTRFNGPYSSTKTLFEREEFNGVGGNAYGADRCENSGMGDHSTSEPDQSADRSRVAVAVPRDLPDLERRQLLAAIGGTGATVLAGCADDDALEEPDDDDDADVASYELVFLEDDEETAVEFDEDEEILYPALDAGVDVPYACEVGTCGDCTARYDGDATEVVTHDGNEYLDDDQLAEGWLLTCVAYPEDDFELEVAHPDDE